MSGTSFLAHKQGKLKENESMTLMRKTRLKTQSRKRKSKFYSVFLLKRLKLMLGSTCVHEKCRDDAQKKGQLTK